MNKWFILPLYVDIDIDGVDCRHMLHQSQVRSAIILAPPPSVPTSRISQELLPLRLWTSDASTRVLQNSLIGSDHALVTCAFVVKIKRLPTSSTSMYLIIYLGMATEQAIFT